MRRAALRPALIAGMLGASALLATALATSAVLSAREQRATAERVLRDYAALGAESAAQRLRAALSGRLNTVLLAAASIRTAVPPLAASVRVAVPASARDVITEAARFLRVGVNDSLAPLLRRETAALPAYAYFGLAWLPGDVLLAFQRLHDASAPVTAFTLPLSDVSSVLAKLIATDPVLPASLIHGATPTRGIGLRVTGAPGVLADREFSPSSPYDAPFALGRPYGDLSVDVSLDEHLASTLIIGGLPRSRVPLLLGLLALTIVVTIAAGDQLRRELELSRLREDFVSSVSHELRTPLSHIRLFVETLQLGRVRNEHEGERSLSILNNEARRLEHLVENLLYFSRAERRALAVETVPIDLTSLLHEIVAEFVPLASHGHSTIALNAEGGVRARVDAAAVRHIVLNLLDNAVKYGRAGQQITVTLTRTRGAVHLSVDDEGGGVAAADRARVWERFWRGSGKSHANVTGTGIGLAIVRDLVHLHGGAALVDVAPSGGARFVITLPAAQS